jgi:soluble lytic murein transglycosylase-like protein
VGGLTRALAALGLLCASPVSAAPPDPWAQHIAEASIRFDIPGSWIRSVIRAESGGRTLLNGRPIVSPAGAMGLMQLMPRTWRELRASLRLGDDPHDPRDNILAGTAYLRAMYDRFGYPGLFAAYNSGPTRYRNHLRTGRRLPAETRAYVANVVGPGSAIRTAAPSAPSSTALFALRPTDWGAGAHAGSPDPVWQAGPAGGELFVRLSASID